MSVSRVSTTTTSNEYDETSRSDHPPTSTSSSSTASHQEKLAYVNETKLYKGICADQWPIVYHHYYNISFLGLEKLHPFDSTKWRRVHDKLIEFGMLEEYQFVQPGEASEHDLRVVHTDEYLSRLKRSGHVASLVEIYPVAYLPSFVVNNYLLKPFRYHTGGSILAARLALERNWAINLGGGFHHASHSRGGGFCVYADISLALNFLFLNRLIARAMIVDLDAHQGNGHEIDFAGDNRVYIFDMFNSEIYPGDITAKSAISRSVPLKCGTGDAEYLNQLSRNLNAALGEFSADIIVYNAGTDCLVGDTLGLLSLTPDGVIRRDQIVFESARQSHIPIVMLMSGGYMPDNYEVVAQSILNLFHKKIISLPSGTF